MIRPFFLLLLFFACFATATANERPPRPNVLLILADDLGFSDLSCYGSEIATPNIDRLAGGGTRFSAFYTSARCCPSRASLMTGLHPHQTGIGSFATRDPRPKAGPAYTGHLLPTCATLAEMLGSAGYSTWMVGKWHMGIPGPVERGFQNYYGYRNFLAYAEDQWDPSAYVRLPESATPELSPPADSFYATDVFGDYALAFIRKARAERADQPWFLYLAHSSPHFPVQAPKASIDRHMATYLKGWDVLRAERFARQKQLGIVPPDASLPPLSQVPVDRDDIANGYAGRTNPPWSSLPPERQTDLARRMATFAAMVEHVDRGIGAILDDLEKNGDLDNTLILFLSDNGACYEWGPFGFDGPSRKGTTTLHEGDALAAFGQRGSHSSYGSGWANLGNTPLNMYKHFCHEGGISSPLVAHWPAGFPRRGAWVHDPTHLMDIVPTVLEATGANYPGEPITPAEGVSLLPAIASGASVPLRSIPTEHQSARGLRKGGWKIVWGKRQPEPVRWELYDLRNDRSEQHDLAAENPDTVAGLAAEWEAWARRVGAEPFYLRAPASPEQPKASPGIAGRPFAVTATVESDAPHGVVITQGGREQGYALHFVKGGTPAFDVRVGENVTRLLFTAPVRGRITLRARLDADRMTLEVNGAAVSAPSPGLIPTQPKDPLSIGADALTAAGDYDPPNRFNGTIIATGCQPEASP